MISVTQLNAMTINDLVRLNKMIVGTIKQKQQNDNRTAIFSFMPGDKVKFTSNRNGMTYRGEVTDVKRTKVVVKTQMGNYLVPASLLVRGE